MNNHWTELLAAFNTAEVQYLVIGGHAVGFHAQPRYTRDLDIWIDNTQANAKRVYKALRDYGAPNMDQLSADDFCDPNSFYRMGREPLMIDILFGLQGLIFAECWPRRHASTFLGVPAFFISAEDLIANKSQIARPQDLADIAAIRKKF